MNTSSSLLLTVVGCLALTAQLSGQSASLPVEMESGFNHQGHAADRMFFPGEPYLRLSASFENNALSQGVTLFWTFHTVASLHSMKEEFVATSYKPTAVCKKAGEGNSIYVAGWSERLGAALIEEWTFTDYEVLGPAITPETDPDNPTESASLGNMTISKSLIFLCSNMHPISGIVSNAHGNELFILEEAPPSERAVFALDLLSTSSDCAALLPTAFGSPLILMTSAEFPSLGPMVSFTALDHPEDGFFIYLESNRPWDSIFATYEPYEIIVLRDSQRDGSFESLEVQSYTDFYTSRPLASFRERYD